MVRSPLRMDRASVRNCFYLLAYSPPIAASWPGWDFWAGEGLRPDWSLFFAALLMVDGRNKSQPALGPVNRGSAFQEHRKVLPFDQ